MSLLKKIIKNITRPVVNNSKGAIGEAKVNAKLNPIIFNKVEHRQINNLVLTDDNGKTHQIDHVEIRKNGIFCIETKNYTGLILGGENQDHWTQCLYNGEKHQFINPIKQNKSHLYHLNRALGNKYRINSVVVMVQNNADRINLPNVVNLSDLSSYLKKFNNGASYSTAEIEDIYNKLLRASSKVSNKQHIQSIKKTQNELKNGICPRCGKKLILRNGKYGEFWGCSGYPKCSFTLKNK